MSFLRAVVGPGLFFCACLGATSAFAQPANAPTANDYPTAARVDYVFACMQANGTTRESLDRCSCSIDVVATILPYDRYVTGETVASLIQLPGERSAVFRSAEPARAAADELRRAQAEAEVRCF
ncbi:hypothetical protein [Terrihabitans sp. B22-R8]|uniref:hypothetical protein n=1 Tax=Terrihabitans sp. B22-R8 TaxID=3425128 RepID=UPI00403C79D3